MADEKIGGLFVQLEARTKKLERQLKTSEKQSKKAGVKSGKAFSIGFAGALAVLFAFKKAFDFAVQAKNAARDAVETGNKFDTVFSSMKKGANEMADSFAKSFGLAGSTARELLGNTGDLLVGFGFTEKKAFDLSRQVNSLAQDLASFTNFAGGAKGASAALTKGILGETESVKALGIVLRQNTPEFREQMRIKTQLEGLTVNQARAEILLAEAYKQSKKAIGDYARTQDDLANVERKANEELKEVMESLGKRLIPLFIEGTKVAIGFARSVGNLTDFLFPLSTNMEKATEKGLNQRIAFETLVSTYERLNGKASLTTTETENYASVIARLQGLYPKLLGNLDLHKNKLELVRKGFESVRKEIEISLRIEFRKAQARDVIEEQEEFLAHRIRLQEKNDELDAKIRLRRSGDIEDRMIVSHTKGTAELESTIMQREFDKRFETISEFATKIDEKQKEINKILSGDLFLGGDGGGGGDGDGGLKKIIPLFKQIDNELKILEKRKIEILPGEEEELGRINAQIEVLLGKLERLDLLGLTEVVGIISIDEDLQRLQEDIDKKEIENLNTKKGLHADYAGGLDDEVNLWADLGDAQSTAMGQLAASWANQIELLKDANSMLQEFINLLVQVAIQQAALAGVSFITGGISSLLGLDKLFAHSGGTFQDGKKVASFAGGGSFTVPSGFSNDSFPMMVESGERVTVTPKSAVGNQDKLLSQVNSSIQEMSMILQSKDFTSNVLVNIDSDSLVKNSIKPAENRLTNSGVKFDS